MRINQSSDTVSAEIGNAGGAVATTESVNYFDSDVDEIDLVSSLYRRRDQMMSASIRRHKYVLCCFQSVNLLE